MIIIDKTAMITPAKQINKKNKAKGQFSQLIDNNNYEEMAVSNLSEVNSIFSLQQVSAVNNDVNRVKRYKYAKNLVDKLDIIRDDLLRGKFDQQQLNNLLTEINGQFLNISYDKRLESIVNEIEVLIITSANRLGV
jgi:hypothetical protein